MLTMDDNQIDIPDALQKAASLKFTNIPAVTEPESSKCFAVPEYTIEGYRAEMDQWAAKSDSATIDSLTLSEAESKIDQNSYSEQSEERASATASLWGLFRFGDMGQSAHDYKTQVKSNNSNSKVDFKFSWKQHKLFPLAPGGWSVHCLSVSGKALTSSVGTFQTC